MPFMELSKDAKFLERESSWLPDKFKHARYGWRVIDGSRRGWRIEIGDGWCYDKWDDEENWYRYYPATLD